MISPPDRTRYSRWMPVCQPAMRDIHGYFEASAGMAAEGVFREAGTDASSRGRRGQGAGVNVLCAVAVCWRVPTISWSALCAGSHRPPCHERIVKVTMKPMLASRAGAIRGLINEIRNFRFEDFLAVPRIFRPTYTALVTAQRLVEPVMGP